MSDSYDFFGGPTSPEPPPFGSVPAAAAPAAASVAAPRPGAVSLLSGVLVVQAALVAMPGMLLLLVRDVVHRVLDEVMSAATTYGGLDSGSLTGASAPTSRLTVWGLALVLVAVASAVAGAAALAGHAWGWLTALAAQVALLLVVLTHIADYHVVGTVGLLTVAASGALLASAPVRRWCGPA